MLYRKFPAYEWLGLEVTVNASGSLRFKGNSIALYHWLNSYDTRSTKFAVDHKARGPVLKVGKRPEFIIKGNSGRSSDPNQIPTDLSPAKMSFNSSIVDVEPTRGAFQFAITSGSDWAGLRMKKTWRPPLSAPDKRRSRDWGFDKRDLSLPCSRLL